MDQLFFKCQRHEANPNQDRCDARVGTTSFCWIGCLIQSSTGGQIPHFPESCFGFKESKHGCHSPMGFGERDWIHWEGPIRYKYIYIQYRNVIYAIYIYICIIKYIQLQCTRTSFNILPAAPPFNKARYPKCILTSKLVLYIDLAGITYGMVAGNSSQSLVACDLGWIPDVIGKSSQKCWNLFGGAIFRGLFEQEVESLYNTSGGVYCW